MGIEMFPSRRAFECSLASWVPNLLEYLLSFCC